MSALFQSDLGLGTMLPAVHGAAIALKTKERSEHPGRNVLVFVGYTALLICIGIILAYFPTLKDDAIAKIRSLPALIEGWRHQTPTPPPVPYVPPAPQKPVLPPQPQPRPIIPKPTPTPSPIRPARVVPPSSQLMPYSGCLVEQGIFGLADFLGDDDQSLVESFAQKEEDEANLIGEDEVSVIRVESISLGHDRADGQISSGIGQYYNARVLLKIVDRSDCKVREVVQVGQSQTSYNGSIPDRDDAIIQAVENAITLDITGVKVQ